jgi:predicted pyridoxine 5'-phosphate oxidase superfamily flavin-nucleotide-binding protein
MKPPVSDIAFTPAVKAVQERLGSRRGYASMEQRGGWSDRITPDLAAFVAERDSFYLATATAGGRPYVQHRGGPKGFLRVLDERRLAFADFSGNRQYVSMGNLTENDQAFLFLMDHANRRRIKVWGRAAFVEDDPELLAAVADPDYPGKPERVLVFTVEAWDVNCPQHIPRLYSEDEVAGREGALRLRIEALEEENERLRAGGS